MMTLGRFLSVKAFGLLVQKRSKQADIVEIIASKKVSPETLAKVKQTFDEANKCFNRAIELAPREPEVWMWRGGFRFNEGFYLAGVQAAEGREVDLARAYSTTDSRQICMNWLGCVRKITKRSRLPYTRRLSTTSLSTRSRLRRQKRSQLPCRKRSGCPWKRSCDC